MNSGTGPRSAETTRPPLGECPDCGHAREGTAVSATFNRRRARRGEQPLPVSCSSGYDYGFGDFDQCSCTNPCHSEAIGPVRAI